MGSKINKKRLSLKWIMLIILLALGDLIFVIRYVLQGQNVALFNPKGLIAGEQRNLMMLVVSVLLVIAVPTLFFAFFYSLEI